MYHITHNKEEGYIYLKTTESFTIKDVKVFLRDLVKHADEYQCNRMVIDHRGAEFKASVMEINSIAKYLNSLGFGYKYIGAVVFDRDYEKYEFADAVSKNWSSSVLRFFDNIDEAKKWLLS